MVLKIYISQYKNYKEAISYNSINIKPLKEIKIFYLGGIYFYEEK